MIYDIIIIFHVEDDESCRLSVDDSQPHNDRVSGNKVRVGGLLCILFATARATATIQDGYVVLLQ